MKLALDYEPLAIFLGLEPLRERWRCGFSYLYLASECAGSTNQLGIPLEMHTVAQSAWEAKVLPFWSAFPQDSGVESRIHTKAELCFFCFIDDIVSSFVTVTSDRVSHTRVPASPLHNVEHWGTHLQRPFLRLRHLIPTNLLLEGKFRQDFSVICPVSERVLFYLIAFCWGK